MDIEIQRYVTIFICLRHHWCFCVCDCVWPVRGLREMLGTLCQHLHFHFRKSDLLIWLVIILFTFKILNNLFTIWIIVWCLTSYREYFDHKMALPFIYLLLNLRLWKRLHFHNNKIISDEHVWFDRKHV